MRVSDNRQLSYRWIASQEVPDHTREEIKIDEPTPTVQSAKAKGLAERVRNLAASASEEAENLLHKLEPHELAEHG